MICAHSAASLTPCPWPTDCGARLWARSSRHALGVRVAFAAQDGALIEPPSRRHERAHFPGSIVAARRRWARGKRPPGHLASCPLGWLTRTCRIRTPWRVPPLNQRKSERASEPFEPLMWRRLVRMQAQYGHSGRFQVALALARSPSTRPYGSGRALVGGLSWRLLSKRPQRPAASAR